MFARSILFLTLSLGIATGCSKDEGATKPAATEKASSAEKGHAPAGVKPGSHEDWCVEHAVPESQCTRCNADLIPAFKATNDWCVEHGLPESQCKICNPQIDIKRPPKGS
jgi:hypothetical protein